MQSYNDYKPFGGLEASGTNIPFAKAKTRLGYVEMPKDKESKLGDHGVRKYDTEVGRFLAIDPLWEKYHTMNPFQYSGNSPVMLKDVDGFRVFAIYTGPTSINQDGFTSNSQGGHIAIGIDNNIYSFNGDGKWHVYNYNDYISNESKIRDVGEVTLKINQEQVEKSLNLKPGENQKYDITNNSCVSNTMEVLQKSGLNLSKPNGAVLPAQLFNALATSNQSENSTIKPNYSGVSLVGRLMQALTKTLEAIGINLTGATINTKPLTDETKK